MISRDLIRRFVGDASGGVALMAALGLVPMFTAVGVAVDYSRAAAARTGMQAALDASAIAMAKAATNADTTHLSAQAEQSFKANFQSPSVSGLTVLANASSTSTGYGIELSASGSLKPRFLGIVGLSSIAISVRSTAVSYADGLGCVLSLNQHASSAVNGPGTASVRLNGCSLYDNSDSATALTVGGSTQISALSIGVVGGLTGESNISTEQGIRTKIGAVTDPYKDDAYPPFGGCTVNNLVAHSAITLNPGVYCGGMMINAGATVTLNSGIYYLDGGSLSVTGGATLTGEGVTLVFTSQNRTGYATATINGNASINLTPPRVGPTAGIVVFGDRNMPTGASFKFNGGAAQYLGGAVYVPKGDLSYAGGQDTSSSCSQLIADTVTFTGNSKMALNCNGYGTKPFSPLVVRLES